MSTGLNLGEINGHTVGRVLKEAVRRAMVTVRNERLAFEATIKASYSGTMDDVFTSADTKAQEVYVRTLRECFPNCGIIAEEKSLSIPPKNGCTAYFTVDPVDGTKAFVRRQSHGVGTMIALIDKGEIICAYIGDIMTGEVYGYRPGSNSVWRISDLDMFVELKHEKSPDGLRGAYALLRDPSEMYSSDTQQILRHFKNHEVSGGSIGIWAARLWKGEVGALFLLPGWETPWDSNPVIGISMKLGFAFFVMEEGMWVRRSPKPVSEMYKRPTETMIIHPDDIAPQMNHYFMGG